MKFYDMSRPLYLKMDAFSVGLRERLLQVREGMNCGCDEVPDNVTLCPITFASKSLLNAEQWYSNIEWEALGILYGLKKFHHYCFAKKVYVITEHKPLAAMVHKHVATLSKQLQCIMLYIHQYSVCILYKPGPQLYIADWLSQNSNAESREQEITVMHVNMHAINSTVDSQICTFIEDMQTSTNEVLDLQRLKAYIIRGYSHTKDYAEHSIQKYWPIRHELVRLMILLWKANE